MSDFIERVAEHFDELTKSHKDVANYFLYNLDKVAVNTLEELAGIVGVSTTTVIRFAKQMGYSGFTQLQKDAQNIVLNKEKGMRNGEGLENRDTDHLLKEAFERDLRNIEGTMKSLKQEDLDQATKLLLEADNLYIMGMRMAFSVAYYCFASWGRMRKNIRLIHTTGMEYPEEMLSMKNGDVCIIFTFPRYVTSQVRLMQWMKKHGVRIILVTAGTYSVEREFSDIVLACRVKKASYQNSYAAPVCLVNYFTMAMAAKKYDEAAALLKNSEELLGPGFYINN